MPDMFDLPRAPRDAVVVTTVALILVLADSMLVRRLLLVSL